MPALPPSPIYDDLLDLLVESVDADRLLTFRLRPDRQALLEDLLQRNRDSSLTAVEREELGEYERLEHVGRMLKARLRQKRSS